MFLARLVVKQYPLLERFLNDLARDDCLGAGSTSQIGRDLKNVVCASSVSIRVARERGKSV